MNSFKIAYKLLKNNLKIYELYLTVLIFTIATYYNFVAIQYNNQFIALTKRLQSAMVATTTCGFVLICTVVFFMWHANGFFFKQRQKETALYMLMGITSSKIGIVFALESIFLGGLSMLIGLPIGILFSKLFFMLLTKSMSLTVVVPFSISSNAILQLVIIFGIIFIILGANNYSAVRKSQLINMINASKKKSALPKLNYKKGILGILIIIAGYVIAVNIKHWELDLLLASMTTLIMVCFGTYLFFGSFLTLVFSKLIKYKNIIYKDVRLVSVNNIFFRLKLNYKSLAMTAILAASTVTAFSISLSFKQFADNDVIIENPYSFSYENNDAKVKNRVIETINESSHQLLGMNEVNFCISNIEYLHKNKLVDKNSEAIITSYSEIEKTLKFLKYSNQKSILKKIKPTRNEAVFILNANTMASPINVQGNDIKIRGKEYYIKSDIKIPFIGNIPVLGNKNIYVLEDSEYQKLKLNLSEVTFNGIKISDEKNSQDLIKKIGSILPGGLKKIDPGVTEYIWEYYALGIFFFLGLVISIVFILATFSTLYFKILSDGLMDKEQYTILKKIGMSKKEVQKSIYMQVGIAFILPVIVGIVHSLVAMKMLEEIMNVSFLLQKLCSIGIFVCVMLVFYVAISTNYTKMVYDK